MSFLAICAEYYEMWTLYVLHIFFIAFANLIRYNMNKLNLTK